MCEVRQAKKRKTRRSQKCAVEGAFAPRTSRQECQGVLKIVENRSDIFYLSHVINKLSGLNLIIKKPAVDLVK
jgi:hypothetical protein